MSNSTTCFIPDKRPYTEQKLADKIQELNALIKENKIAEFQQLCKPEDAALHSQAIADVADGSKASCHSPLLHSAIYHYNIDVFNYLLDNCKVDPFTQFTYYLYSGNHGFIRYTLDSLAFAIFSLNEFFKQLAEYCNKDFSDLDWAAIASEDESIVKVWKPKMDNALLMVDVLLQRAFLKQGLASQTHHYGATYESRIDKGYGDSHKFDGLTYFQYASFLNNLLGCARILRHVKTLKAMTEVIEATVLNKEDANKKVTAAQIAKKPEAYEKMVAVCQLSSLEQSMGSSMLESTIRLSNMTIQQ